MRLHLFAPALLTALLLAGCHALAPKEEKIAATPETLKLGRTVFRENCARCHRPGANQEAPNLMEVKALPASKIRKMVRHGDPGEMPAFSEKDLSEAELTALVAHLQHARERYAARKAQGAGEPKGAAPKLKKAERVKTKPAEH